MNNIYREKFKFTYKYEYKSNPKNPNKHIYVDEMAEAIYSNSCFQFFR